MAINQECLHSMAAGSSGSTPWWQDEEIYSCCFYFYKCIRKHFCIIFQLFEDI